MEWWPFKNMILRGKSSEAEASGMKPKYLFHFGDSKDCVQDLHLSNRLTGYSLPPFTCLVQGIVLPVASQRITRQE